MDVTHDIHNYEHWYISYCYFMLQTLNTPGGMIYDEELQKGVKKRFIPPSVNVSFPSTATYDDIIDVGRETFFPDESSSLDTFCLCDSSGIMFKVQDHSRCDVAANGKGLYL